MDKLHPYVSAALICEKVLQEKDESVTLIRLADRIQYNLEGPGLPSGAKPMIGVQGFVSLKSGPVTGGHTLSVIVENPIGQRREVWRSEVNLLGKDQGQNLILNISLGIDHDGLFWFDVLFDDEVLSRIPLTVTQAPKQTGGEPTS